MLISDVAELVCSDFQQHAMHTSMGSSKDVDDVESGAYTSTTGSSHHLVKLISYQ